MRLADKYGVTPRLLRKVLKLAGIDNTAELIQRYQSGELLSDIASSIRMHVFGLAKLFKANGHRVQRGPRIAPLTQKEISAALFGRQTINTAARSLCVHWETAKKLLIEFGFLSQKNADQGAPYTLELPFHNTS